jgi:hypothetical protein
MAMCSSSGAAEAAAAEEDDADEKVTDDRFGADGEERGE